MESIDKAIFRMVSESSGRNESKRIGDLETPNPEAEPPVVGRRQHGSVQLTDAMRHSGGAVATAR
jgi:hypothetical protein